MDEQENRIKELQGETEIETLNRQRQKYRKRNVCMCMCTCVHACVRERVYWSKLIMLKHGKGGKLDKIVNV